MVQSFRPSANTVARVVLLAIVALPAASVAAALILVRSDYVTGEGWTPEQQVSFSHRHHAAEVGIDCRYCHTSVETSRFAGIPSTATCMTCHSQIWTEATMLAPVRQAWVEGPRLAWARVNELPDYAYFAHAPHVANGVACATCHGPVGEMRLTRQAAPLTMGWCLECHRDPAPRLSPPGTLYTAFEPEHADGPEAAHALLVDYGIKPEGLSECSVCHR